MEFLLELLSSGMMNEEILADYEDLAVGDLSGAIAWAAKVTRTKRIGPMLA